MQINLTVTLTADPALLAILSAIAGSRTTATENQALPVTEKTKTAKVSTLKVATAENAVPVATKSSTDSAPKTEAETGDAKTQFTLESLRAQAVPLSKAGHKDTIKNWLSEAGYASLQDLDPKDFNAFHSFITKLS